MKKRIFSFIVILAGLLASAPATFAQTVFYDKGISGPDPNGVYTLELEAYVTGSKVTSETLVPTDIVLSLAYAVGLTDAERVQLRKAIATFVQIIQEKDEIKNDEGEVIGHVGYRVSIDLFSTKFWDIPGYDASYFRTLHPVGDFVARVEGSEGYLSIDGVDLFPRSGSFNNSGDYANDVLQRAYDLLSSRSTQETERNEYGEPVGSGEEGEIGKESDRASTVVFFCHKHVATQGQGHWNSNDTDGAKLAIQNADNLKGIGATVVSVGLENNPLPEEFLTMLYLTSSDNKSTDWTFPNPSHNVSGEFSMLANANTLEAIFQSIASSIGGDYNIGSASSVLVDIVATSFTVSMDADLGLAKVYKVKCIDDRPNIVGEHMFSSIKNPLNTVATEEELDNLTGEDRDNTVCLKVDPVTGEVVVSGFNYGENWCGYETFADGSGKEHGYKIVLEIPITANQDAVGGPNVLTNAEGSGLILKDDEDNIIGTYEFHSPDVSLPVNIHIEKTGLNTGESAKFTIERAYMPASGLGEDVPEGEWRYVSTVFVTKTSDEETPLVKVRGLPANGDVPTGEYDDNGDPITEQHNFVYRVREEGWGWSYEPGPEYKNPQYTDTKHVDNPFRFNNQKRSNIQSKVHHAESKVTNVFKTGGGPEYVDSKNNGR